MRELISAIASLLILMLSMPVHAAELASSEIVAACKYLVARDHSVSFTLSTQPRISPRNSASVAFEVEDADARPWLVVCEFEPEPPIRVRQYGTTPMFCDCAFKFATQDELSLLSAGIENAIAN
jgi:hypothetical protein